MKANIWIVVALITGAICKYIFFRVYGITASSTYVIELADWICSAPISGKLLFYIQDAIVELISTLFSYVIPSIIFGYFLKDIKKLVVSSLAIILGSFLFDVLYYSFFMKDFSLFLSIFEPISYFTSMLLTRLLLVIVFLYIGMILNKKKTATTSTLPL